jgi:predicted esterase
MTSTPDGGPIVIRFLAGADEDYPVLLVLAPPGSDPTPSIAFCRAIHPSASVLVPDFSGCLPASGKTDRQTEDAVLARLSASLSVSISALGIALLPIIVIGVGTGADLAARFALRKNQDLAAAMLFRPKGTVSSPPTGSLEGLTVLLVTTARADAAGSIEWKIRNAFSSAGAQVICEYVSTRSRRSEHDAALARVFIASHFGLSD